jgi:hypothetical protein
VAILDPGTLAKLGTLQAFDDAIAFRLDRLNSPCEDCTPDEKCKDHACDVHLIAQYHDKHGSVLREVFAGMDPDKVLRATQDCDGTPSTVIAVSMVMTLKLRELAADGPIVIDLGSGPVIVELDGPQLVQHTVGPGQ